MACSRVRLVSVSRTRETRSVPRRSSRDRFSQDACDPSPHRPCQYGSIRRAAVTSVVGQADSRSANGTGVSSTPYSMPERPGAFTRHRPRPAPSWDRRGQGGAGRRRRRSSGPRRRPRGPAPPVAGARRRGCGRSRCTAAGSVTSAGDQADPSTDRSRAARSATSGLDCTNQHTVP